MLLAKGYDCIAALTPCK